MDRWSNIPEALRPKEILFFSADIVGSTALKQKPVQVETDLVIPDNSEWFELIQKFYINSAAYFLEEFGGISSERAPDYIKAMKAPKIWKTVGDEVLFWVEITDTRQVIEYIKAWMTAINRLREADIYEKDGRLDVKCTAWIAHFPWRNKMIFSSPSGSSWHKLEGNRDNNLELTKAYFEDAETLQPDFVGPGIDIGFRLAGQANQRRFVISTDIAFMIAVTAKRKRQHLDVRVHFEGLQLLKGVLGGLEYPVFWIDMSQPEDIYTFGNDLTTREPCDHPTILKFMEGFYNRRSNYMYEPFVISETEEILKDGEDWYFRQHMKMLSEAGFLDEFVA